MTVFLEMPDVARVEPTILQHRGSCFRLTVVTTHHVRTAHKYLAVVSNLDFNAFERYSHRSDVIVARPVCRDDARLRRAITLQDRYAGSQVRVRQRRRKGRATGNEVSQTPAHTLAPLRKYQFTGKLLLDSEPRRDPLPFV